MTDRVDWGRLLLRLMIGGLLLFHGIFKLRSGIGWMAGMLSTLSLPAFIGYGVYLGEIVAPLLVLIGKWSRLGGLLIAGNMVAAILLARRDAVAALNQGGGWAIEVELLFLVGGIVIFLLGSGRIAVSRGVGRWD